MRSDGRTLWIQLVPGEVGYNALQAGDGAIAVVFRQRNTLELATYSLDGERRWQQALHVYDNEQDADNAEEIVSGAFVGGSLSNFMMLANSGTCACSRARMARSPGIRSLG